MREQPPAEQAKLWGRCDNMLLRLDGNLYGRSTAGSAYSDELEELLCVELKETGRCDFRRGVKDPCVYRCLKTGIVVARHISTMTAALPDRFLNEDLCTLCEITTGPLGRCFRRGLRRDQDPACRVHLDGVRSETGPSSSVRWRGRRRREPEPFTMGTGATAAAQTSVSGEAVAYLDIPPNPGIGGGASCPIGNP